MSSTRVFIVQDNNSKVVAVYSDESLAKKLLSTIETKLKSKCFIVSKLVNADLSIVGNDDVNN